MSLDADTKTNMLGMFLAGIDGRDPRPYVLNLDGDQCVLAHNVLKRMDDLLKGQWKLMGAPTDQNIL